MMLEAKVFALLIPADFSAFHAHEILTKLRRPKTNLNISLDGLHATLKAQLFTVQAQIIVSGVIPYSSGVIMIKIPPVFVRLLDEFFHILAGIGAALNGLPDAILR